MIIDTVYHPKLLPRLLTHHYDYKDIPVKSPHTYRLVAENSEYVQNNKVLLYIVGIDSTLLDNSLTEILSKEYIQSIKNKELLLAIDLTIEAMYVDVDRIYQHLVIEQSIPESQILLISTTLDLKDYIITLSQKLNKQPIKYEYYGHWARVQKITFSESLKELGYQDFNTYKSGLYASTKKKFIFLNNNWKEHRIALLCLLHHENLLTHSYTSFNGKPVREGLYDRLVKNKQPVPDWLLAEQTNSIEQNWKTWIGYTTEQFPNISIKGIDVHTQLPLTLDTKEFNIHIPYHLQSQLSLYYKNTYFSVVTETGFKNDSPVFLTEKIFKPISFKHPFINCGQPYSLAHLRMLGYKTYDGLIDESYDTELDNNIRMIKIVNEIKRLCNLNEIELQNFKDQAKPIAEYNYNLFLEDHFIRTVI